MEKKYDIYSEMNLGEHSNKETDSPDSDPSDDNVIYISDDSVEQDEFLQKLAGKKRIVTSDVSSSGNSDGDDDDDGDDGDGFVVIPDDDSESVKDDDNDDDSDSDILDDTLDTTEESDFEEANHYDTDSDNSQDLHAKSGNGNKPPQTKKNSTKHKRSNFARYFQKNISIVCRRCQQIGHMSSQCYNDPHMSPCYACGSTSHLSQKCDQLLCLKCGGEGHTRYNCKNKKISCFSCYAPGHFKSDCPVFTTYQVDFARCPKCLELNCNCRTNLTANIRQTCPMCGGSHRMEDHDSSNSNKYNNNGNPDNNNNRNKNHKSKYGKNQTLDLDKFYITPQQYYGQRDNSYKSKRFNQSNPAYEFGSPQNARNSNGRNQFHDQNNNEFPPRNRQRYQDDYNSTPPENTRRSKKGVNKVNHSKFQYYDDDSFQYKPYPNSSGKKRNTKKR